MSSSIDYKEGNHQEFIHYLFSNEPKSPHTIVLESPPLEPDKNIGLHLFEQLLMIFVDGLKYFHSDSHGKVDVHTLTSRDIETIQVYFKSFGYDCLVHVFETMHEYQFRYPNYFKEQSKIVPTTTLHDFYYEIFGTQNRVFRVSFTSLRL